MRGRERERERWDIDASSLIADTVDLEAMVIARVDAAAVLRRLARTKEGRALILDALGVRPLSSATRRRYRIRLRALGFD